MSEASFTGTEIPCMIEQGRFVEVLQKSGNVEPFSELDELEHHTYGRSVQI